MRLKRSKKTTAEPGAEMPVEKKRKRIITRIIGGVLLLGVLVDGGLYLHARYWDYMHGFPWEDVEACLYNNPRKLKSRCPGCLRHKKKIHFRSPRWTWQKMCGRSGELTICEHCQLQFDFEVGAIN